MADFHVRADSVDVEQIMRQIRARIREKRGVDYTEEQIHELARVKLERFLDPKGIRSDLLEEYRRTPVGEHPPNYEFDDQTLFASDKAVVRFFRTLFRPFLKLLFNPNTLNLVLHTQSEINRVLVARANRDSLVFELMHNLVLETTRTTIEVKNLKMRVESLSSRLDFAERRARALEAVVQYRPDAGERAAGGPPPLPAGDAHHRRGGRSRQRSDHRRRKPAHAPAPAPARPEERPRLRRAGRRLASSGRRPGGGRTGRSRAGARLPGGCCGSGGAVPGVRRAPGGRTKALE